MKVQAFKFLTGEEVVARVIDETPTSYTLDYPQTLQFQRVSPTEMGLAFVPWVLSNPKIDGLVVDKKAVVAVFTPDADVEKQYLQQTSKIALLG